MLARLGVSIKEMSFATGMSERQLQKLIVTAEVAVYLHQALPQIPAEYWIQAAALHRFEQKRAAVPRRAIRPIRPKAGLVIARIEEPAEPEPAMAGCLCGHEQQAHRSKHFHCRSCACPFYLSSSISVAAYTDFLEKHAPQVTDPSDP